MKPHALIFLLFFACSFAACSPVIIPPEEIPTLEPRADEVTRAPQPSKVGFPTVKAPTAAFPSLTFAPSAAPTTAPTVAPPTAAVPTYPAYQLCSQAPVGEPSTCVIELASCSYQPKVKGSPTFCNDAPYPNHAFTFLVWGRDLSELNGRCLIVSGKIEMYKGKPEITSENSSAFIGYCDE